MDPFEDQAAHCRPSYLESTELPERLGQVYVDDIKVNLLEQFSLVASSDTSRKNSLDSKDHLEVFLRVRPLTASEVAQNESQDCVHIEDSTSVVLKPPINSLAIRLSDKGCTHMVQKFTFSHVFGPETSQTEFFEGTVKESVRDFLDGRNRLIFTYGVTNAGKTYTFQGTPDHLGILPRSMNMLFSSIQNKQYSKMDLKPHRCQDYVRLTKDQMKKEISIKNAVLRFTKEMESRNNSQGGISLDPVASIVEGSVQSSDNILSDFEERSKESEQYNLNMSSLVKFSIWVSFCEIYNEYIYDLLEPMSNKFHKRKTLRLAEDMKGCSFVKDLQWIQVSDSKEAYRLLHLGKKCQSFASTKLNSVSSRSHSIFTFRMLWIEDSEIPRVTKVSELSLCDLAGSERCTKTRNEGDRLKESGNINTSLHILGKCINALKNNQQTKLPQHVPFRESKLTHYLQSFFCGKGKACMIVNISQAASVYDETLNVLKFSAVAQKVLLLDTSKPPPRISFGNPKSARDLSFIINNADNKSWSSKKRATIHWDSQLEDVIEDDYNGDMDEETEDQDADGTFTDQSLEEEVVKNDEKNIMLAEEEYQKLLDIIEDLKNKLVNEKKQNLIMELKIRDEIAKEFSEHLAQRENDFSDRLKKERELLEERSDERIAIFQDLVSKCTEEPETAVEEIKADSSITHAIAQDENNGMPIGAFIDSIQEDLAVIKDHAVTANLHIKAIPNNECVASLEEKLGQVTAELSRTQNELVKKDQELEMQRNNLSRTTNQLEQATEKIEELMCILTEKDSAVIKLQDLLSHWEDKVENYDKTVKNMKGEMLIMRSDGINEEIQLCGSMDVPAGRKRPPENEHALEQQPPAKKGTEQWVCTSLPAEQEHIEMAHNRVSEKGTAVIDLQEELDIMQNRLTVLTEQLQDERAEKENLRGELENMQHALSSSQQNTSELSEEVPHMTSKYEKLISEFQTQNEINNGQKEKISTLITEVENNKLNISEKVSQIKNIQLKIDLLGQQQMEMETLDLEDSTQINCTSHGKSTLPDTFTVTADGRSSAFHCAIESLWKECKRVVEVSSKKNNHVHKLEEQLVSLKEEMERVTLENSQLKLKLSENTVLNKLQEEEENLVDQLRKQLLASSAFLNAEKQCLLEVSRKLAETEKQNAVNEEKMKEFNCLLRTLESKNCSLEEQLFQKKSAIEELQQKHHASENNIKILTDQEINLKWQIQEMQNKLNSLQHSLHEKDKQEETGNQETEQLRKKLSDSSAHERTLKLDLERKEEEYTDLKEKLADAKKQIQQVEREISAMREENKLMSNKVNEYEKIKNQMTYDLDLKQRTIQQLKKEQMDNQNMDLYQNCCKELQAKERLIEDMRLTLLEQEQTQAEQDKALEAKIEEAVKLTTELEEWKHSCRLLENIKTSHECQQIANDKCGVNNPMGEELLKLQETLKDCEEKHKTDRKKWLEEKMGLIAQAKEAENHRNREMRKFAEDRERHLKQQTDVENLSSQLSEKDKDLQKWREERDQLVAALEVQLKNLVSSNMQKDEEIEKLKENMLLGPEVESKNVMRNPVWLQDASNCEKVTQNLAGADESKTLTQSAVVSLTEAEELAITKKVNEEQTKNNKIPSGIQKGCTKHQMKTRAEFSSRSSEDSSIDNSEDHSDIVLDSSALSTENGKTSRFPKPQLEIQFTPLQPNRMEVKHQGSASPVTIKINRNLRKRKSHEMDEDMVKSENKKNATPRITNTLCSRATPSTGNQKKFYRKESSLRKQISTSSVLSARKKDGTLQKIGDLLHSSPTIFHTKAKKLIQTISTSKPAVVDRPKENESKPKRSRRKLYCTDISAPLDIPSHPIIMDNNVKESDHLIMKRRLRAKTAK